MTIKDLAKESGYTVTTVSRALNNSPLVAEKTRRKILEIAEKHGYEPSALARNLVTQSSSAICVIVPDITNPYFPLIVKAVQDEARRHDYLTFVCNSGWTEKGEVELARLMYGQRVAGIIMDPSSDFTFRRIREAKIRLPIVFVGNRTEEDEASSVLVDNQAAVELGVEYLVGLGHREIAFIGGQENTYVNRKRQEGFRVATSRLLGTEKPFLISSAYQVKGGYDATHVLITSGHVPTAVMCINDIVAFGVIRCLREHGYQVPRDVSVMGFDDVEFSEHLELTTLREPRYEMGAKAVSILMDTIKSGPDVACQHTHVLFRSELIVRGTCAPPSTV